MTRHYQTQPKPHRVAVTQLDPDTPAGTMGAIDTAGYTECRFDIELSGEDIQRIQLALLFYNTRRAAWFAGAQYEFDSPGYFAIAARTRGAIVFLMVQDFSGTAFELSADYAMS